MSESGTFLFSSLSISESGLLIPEVKSAISLSETEINLSVSLTFGEEAADLAEMERWHNRSLFNIEEEAERNEETAMAFLLELHSKTLHYHLPKWVYL